MKSRYGDRETVGSIYMVFAGIEFHPKGGIKDLYCNTPNLDTIEKEIEESDEDFTWCHIVDSESLNIVKVGVEHNSYFGKIDNSRWEWEDTKNEI